MFGARAWRVGTRPIGTQCLCVVGIMVCGPIPYSPRQTFRPYGTVPPMLNDCYKHFVPTGRFPRPYDCATNVPSLWDGFLRSMIVLHIWSRWDRLVADLRSVRNGNFGG